jgi:hypothetical protein
MQRRTALQREIGALESQLDPGGRVTEELATVRRGLSDGGKCNPTLELPNIRIGFACKERWDDMIGDDRVRACGGCDRPVFNLSSMTRDEAAQVLATRGLTPCVRFYRRPDGTVMTADCPTGERREGRRLAVVASSLAAGTALATPSASAEPASQQSEVAPPDSTEAPPVESITIDDDTVTMGIPIPTRDFSSVEYEMGDIIVEPRERPSIEWSIWGRLGMGVATRHPNVLARSLTPPEPASSSIWEAALATDITLGIARGGDLRVGVWGELRTSSGPVVGGELVVDGLPPHPDGGRLRKSATVVLRAGGNAHVVTGAVGVGFVGAWPRGDSWLRSGHVAGARLVASMNRSRDNPRDWSATIGLEVEPIGAVRAVLDLAKRR